MVKLLQNDTQIKELAYKEYQNVRQGRHVTGRIFTKYEKLFEETVKASGNLDYGDSPIPPVIVQFRRTNERAGANKEYISNYNLYLLF